MKHILLFFLFLMNASHNVYGQTYHWGSSINSTKHMVSANIGWEYAAIVGAGYSYKLSNKSPLFLQAGISVPFGNNVLDDFKTNVGLSGLLFGNNSFKSILSLNGLYKKYTSELVVLNNVGLDIKTINGIYKPKWFVSTEIGLEMALSTHFKHTDTYKQFIYAEVEDGWYNSVSAGMMNFGLQGGYAFQNSDLIFRIGYFKSITSSVNTLIPYYMTLGYNLKI